MLLSMNWVSEFVNLDGLDLDQLIHRFTLSTAEVEEVTHLGDHLQKVVVGHILSVDDHPNSKKLHLLKVDNGTEIVDVVCGAPNVRAGMKVPFACEGGKVGQMDINCATIAGCESHGMCCSEAELGISEDHSGLMEIFEDVAVGTDIKDVYQIADVVFEVDNKSITNRPDLWGHYGIAREFSALTGRPLKAVEQFEDLCAFDYLPTVQIEVEDIVLCYRYTGLKVENVTKKVSPVNMRIRLYYCGMRAINLLADLTNYIMLELGQPMHAFDNRKVDCVEIKRFDQSFKFDTLDGVTRTIDPDMLMICSNDTPVAIAGIMGGLDSEIADDTTSLLLESANFDGVSVRKSTTRLGLRTDASMRYEKVLDPEITVVAIGRFMKLLVDIDPGVVITSSLSDCYARHYDDIDLTITKGFVDRYTGIEISDDQIVSTLQALGFGVVQSDDQFSVHVPSWRATKDVTLNADIIEEITRIYGYDNFAIATTRSPLRPTVPTVGKRDENQIKDLLVYKYNLHEVHSYLWCDTKKYKEIGIEVAENINIANSVTPEHVTLRYSMMPTMLSFINENKTYAPSFGIFEIARVIKGLTDGICNEQKTLSIALFSRVDDEKSLYLQLRDLLKVLGKDLKHLPVSFQNCQAEYPFQHPINTASMSIGGTVVGTMSVLHPANLHKINKKACIVMAELSMDALATIESTEPKYQEPSKFPGIDIDLSFILPVGAKYSEIENELLAVACEELQNIRLIDLYQGEDSASMTLRLAFSSQTRTLSREELQPYLTAVLANLDQKGFALKS